MAHPERVAAGAPRSVDAVGGDDPDRGAGIHGIRRAVTPQLVSIQVGRPRTIAGLAGRKLRTGFGKQPALLPAQVGREGLAGDGQADRRYHGGPDQAALAYCAEHYPRWREELDWPSLPYGGFGENLTVSGADEDSACIGDRWRCPGGVVLEITSPRVPCVKISNFWNRPDLLQLAARSLRIGWYLRVLEEGGLSPGPIELVARPHPGWTIRRAMAALADRGGEEMARLRELPELNARWKA